MDWTRKAPDEPGYYFIRDYGVEEMVSVVMTQDGPGYFEYYNNNFVSCYDVPDAEYLGPIKSEDIINLWKSFEEA